MCALEVRTFLHERLATPGGARVGGRESNPLAVCARVEEQKNDAKNSQQVERQVRVRAVQWAVAAESQREQDDSEREKDKPLILCDLLDLLLRTTRPTVALGKCARRPESWQTIGKVRALIGPQTHPTKRQLSY